MTTEEPKKKKKSKSWKISFEEESVPKHIAEQLLLNESFQNRETAPEKRKHKKTKQKGTETKQNKPKPEAIELENKVRNKKRKVKDVGEDSTQILSDDELKSNRNVEKRKKKRKQVEPTSNDNNEGDDESTTPKAKKTESIREQKRKKYAKLVEEKKIKTELALQEKSLNYLSKWKHSRNEWKFEKLRQIWLQQNMYDPDKIPQEFWDILVLYFGSAKGKVRDVMLKAALKIIEEDEAQEDKEAEINSRTERARDIIQNLQE